MSGAKKMVPKRRFKEFLNAGDWEQRKLSDVADVRDGTHDSPKFYNDGFPLVTSKNLKGGSIDFSDCSFISEQDFNEINKRSKVDPGDILFGMIGTIGNPAIVEHTGFAIKNVALIKEGNIINNRFIYHLLSSKVFENYIARENAGGTQKFIALNQIRNFDFLAPALVEQNKIIELLDCISQNITLHQRKLDKLQATKKALLQEMFPEEGQDKPKRRFKGFTDAWKQRKLSELATMNARIGWQNLRTSEFLDSGDYLLITGTDFDNGRIKYSTCHYVEKKRFDQDTKIQLSTGSILITKDGTLGKVAIVEELPKPATLNAGVFNVRVKDNTLLSYKYLYHYLKAPFLMKYVTANATGGTIKHLNQSILVDFPIPIAEKHEQDKITKLLDSLESIITLHQRKLDKLKNLKQAYLNEMFV